MKSDLTIRILKQTPEDLVSLQRVLESAPDYSYRTTGGLPGQADAQAVFTMLPEGRTYDNKFVYGIFWNTEMVGCIDVIRGYPDKNSAWIGLLLLSERHQHKKFGGQAYKLLESQIRMWTEISDIQLAVVSTNDIVMPFWRKLGFTETGRRTPYQVNQVKADSIVMRKSFAPAQI